VVRFKLTKDVDSHHINQDYETLLVTFNFFRDCHFHFHADSGEYDWMPRTAEVIELVEHMLAVDPDFRGWFDQFIERREVSVFL
jgi:hypothetical protein